MQVNQIIRPAAAEIITIVQLRPGDVYSRMEKRSYATDYVLTLGVVQTVHHNGADAAFTALEIGGFDGSVTLKAYGTDSDLALFTATPEEVRRVLGTALDKAREQQRKAKDDLEKSMSVIATLEDIIANPHEMTTAQTMSAISE